MNLMEIGCESVDWIQLTQDRVKWLVLLNMVTKVRVHKSGKFLDKANDYQLLRDFAPGS
jgi:hypothetical protein